MSEIGVRLSGDNSEFKNMLNDSVNQGVHFGEKLTDKIADKLVGLRDISHVVANALGINLEKIADGIARSVTGISEKTQELWKEIEARDSATTDRLIANQRMRLSEEDKYQTAVRAQAAAIEKAKTLEEEKGKIQEKYAALNYSWLVAFLNKSKEGQELAAKDNLISEARAEAAKAAAEIEARRITQKKEEVESDRTLLDIRETRTANEDKANVARMDASEKIKRLDYDINILEGQINQGYFEGNTLKQAGIELENKIAEKTALQKSATEETRKAAEEIQKGRFEALSLTGKIAYTVDLIYKTEQAIANLKAEGKPVGEYQNALALRKLELTKLQGEQAAKNAKDESDYGTRSKEIQDVLAKGIGNLDEADRARLVTLAGQNSVLQEQISIVNDLTRQFEGLKLSITRTGASYEQQSTESLTGARANLASQLSQASSTGFGRIQDQNFGQNQSFGESSQSAFLKSELAKVNAELALRSQVQNYAAQYGQSAAIQQFGDTVANRALQGMQDTSTQTLTQLQQINQRLQTSGLFPHPNG